MPKWFTKLISGLGVLLAALLGSVYQKPQYMEPVDLEVIAGAPVPAIRFNTISADALGTATFRPSEFKTTLAEGKTEGHSDTTLRVNSITTKDDNTLDPAILGDTIVLHIAPGRTNAEIVKCTGLTTATKTFTGCTFGYRFDKNTTSSSNIEAHSPGETVIISDDDHYLSVQYAALDVRNVFTGQNFFATTTDDLVKIYFGNAATDTDTYIWHNRTTGQFGFATSSSGELAWSTTGTFFTAVSPLSLTSGELKLGTSTSDFVLSGSNLAIRASSTAGIASDSNGLYVDASDEFRFTGVTTFTQATSTIFVIGSSQPTWPVRSGLWVGGNATTTLSLSVSELCFSGTDCENNFGSTATSTAGTATTTSLTAALMRSHSIPAGEASAGDIYIVDTWGRRTGATAGDNVNLHFNSIPVCNANMGATTNAQFNIHATVVFSTNNKVSIGCSGARSTSDASAASDNMSFNYTTTAFPIQLYLDVDNGADSIAVQGFTVYKMR